MAENTTGWQRMALRLRLLAPEDLEKSGRLPWLWGLFLTVGLIVICHMLAFLLPCWIGEPTSIITPWIVMPTATFGGLIRPLAAELSERGRKALVGGFLLGLVFVWVGVLAACFFVGIRWHVLFAVPAWLCDFQLLVMLLALRAKPPAIEVVA